MKIRLWLPNGDLPPFVYMGRADGEMYYYAYNPSGTYKHMNPKEWHGPFHLADAEFREDHTESLLCRGAVLTMLSKFGFTIDNLPGDLP